ncbi:MAG: extracellular solute-binding protein [Clostridiales bacterium]|nr:extracellular solute-binding protein [Clostridiales bacterium]
MKKSIAFIIIFCLLFVMMSSCNNQEAQEDEWSSYPIYHLTNQAEIPLTEVFSSSFDNDFLYVLGASEAESRLLVKVALDDLQVSVLPVDPEAALIAASGETIWIATGQSNAASLIKADRDGNESARIPLLNSWKVVALAADLHNNVYAATKSAVSIFPGDGSILNTFDFAEYNIGSLLLSGEGEVLTQAESRNMWGGQPLYIVDPEAGFSELKSLLSNNAQVNMFLTYSGMGSSSGLLMPKSISSGGAEKTVLAEQGALVYGIELKDGTVKPLFDTAGLDIAGNIVGIAPSSKEYNLILQSESGCCVAKLAGTEDTKKILTIARMENNFAVSSVIMDFNKHSRTYYAVSQLYTDELQLQLDLVSGRKPDLMSLHMTNYEIYARQGLFKNLYDFLDNDPELTKTDLVESVLHALEYQENTLYRICPTYTVFTCAVHEDFVGSDEKWTFSDLRRITDANPDMTLMGSVGGYDMLELMIGIVLPEFLDIETGYVNFDNADFTAFLTYMKEMNDRTVAFSEDADIYKDKRALLQPVYLRSAALYKLQCLNSPYMNLIGLASDHTGGYQIFTAPYFAVINDTGNEDAAWEFIKTMLGEEYQRTVEYLPIRASSLRNMIEDAKVEIPVESITGYLDPAAAAAGANAESYTYQLEVPPLTQEEAQALDSMIGKVDSVTQSMLSDPVLIIIADECRALFAGAKSAEEAAEHIQSRLSIYVSEKE